ncbi:S1 family peptidase [Leucothrix pacifica]|uniref:Serine protease n=1 Tax=Leucothrix pacifica TaxID=1247513 RepID=A0A317CUN7_9GAMM|nr:serine protease [Leucothrix pacifica]PWR00191.1 serine protease [Leucothrix pacifica]
MIRYILLLVLFSSVTQVAVALTDTSSIYEEVESSVYQIRVINNETGKKVAIGSGFVVQQDNILATNYHVVSEYVNGSDVFKLEYLSTDGETGPLELLDLDVIHDLAVVKSTKPMGKPLEISAVPEKGARLYSLGNPLDLGFSIVTGTNNGIMTQDQDGNILFSGNLNGGMSGGPALDESGKVIGVNVATQGNALGFLVPAKYLSVILDRLADNDFLPVKDRFARISEQLIANSERTIERLSGNDWGTTQIGKFLVPAELDKSMRCWDLSRVPKKDDLFRSFLTQCSNQKNTYLSKNLSLGMINYEYVWMDTEKLIPARFYTRYEKMNSSFIESDVDKSDVTNFACHTGFTKTAGQDFKTTVCRRDYLKYKGLSDMLFSTVLVGHPAEGGVFNLDVTGTNHKAAYGLFKKMVESFQWKN